MRKLVALLYLAVVIACFAAELPPIGLSAHKGKDLRQLDEKQSAMFMKDLQDLTGDEPETERSWMGYSPWSVQAFQVGRARWAVLEGYSTCMIPGTSAMRVHVFDEQWNRICKQAYPVGYRFFLNEISVTRQADLGQHLIVTKTTCAGPFFVGNDGSKTPAFEQGPYQRQYYALLGTNIVMVRLEDDKGELARNHYAWSAPSKGPAVPKRIKTEWIKSLGSTNSVEQLAALVWLTGGHLPSKEERKADHNQESIADSTLYESVRDDPETKRLLQDLTKHKTEWIREYAELGVMRGRN